MRNLLTTLFFIIAFVAICSGQSNKELALKDIAESKYEYQASTPPIKEDPNILAWFDFQIYCWENAKLIETKLPVKKTFKNESGQWIGRTEEFRDTTIWVPVSMNFENYMNWKINKRN